MAIADVLSSEYLSENPLESSLIERLTVESMTEDELNALPVGIIQLDCDGQILSYNDYESNFAGVNKVKAVGRNFFTQLAPCTNVQAFHGRFKEGVARKDLRETFRYRFNFKPPRDVAITLFYSGVTESVWVFVRPL